MDGPPSKPQRPPWRSRSRACARCLGDDAIPAPLTPDEIQRWIAHEEIPEHVWELGKDRCVVLPSRGPTDEERERLDAIERRGGLRTVPHSEFERVLEERRRRGGV